MVLAAGSRLGPYEVLTPIGAGGMGEVYRARDTRLERTVAIKVLPALLSSSAEVRQRFEREAKTISQLSHPHICALYDVGSQDGVEYLVMEYLEGETLAERLVKGPLPLEQTLRFGIEIADALDKAHRQGIVHRDLKPGNVMLTKSGVKLLDFGLAKAFLPSPGGRGAGGEGLTSLPTMAAGRSLTQEGTILGTIQYMPPEQLEGKEADARTDIFAFGEVLYEMSTGRKAFSGASQASLISSIMTVEPPPISSIQSMTPPLLDRIVKTCLAKDPEGRWQSAADIARELEWIAQGGSEAAAAATDAVSRRRRQRLTRDIVVALSGAAVAAVAIWALLRGASEPHRAATHVAIEIPPAQTYAFTVFRSLAISPDGRKVAYVAREGETSRLLVRSLDQSETTSLAGTENALLPFFSPDGRWVGFMAAGKFRKVLLAGGPPVVLCDDMGGPVGASWSPDGTIILTRGWPSELVRVPAAGGPPELLAKPTLKGEDRGYLWPEALPGGSAILFTVWTGGSLDDSAIAVRSLRTGAQKILIRGGTSPHYAATGYIVYARRGALFGVPFDPNQLKVTGASFPLAQSVSENTNGGAEFALSQNGTLAYVAGGLRRSDRSLVWVDRKGTASPASAVKRPYNQPRLSPDGKRVAFQIQGETYDIWVLDLDRDNLTRLSFGKDDGHPVWSPDGKRIAFRSSQAGSPSIYLRASDGSGTERRLTSDPDGCFPMSWSPNGRFLAFEKNRGRETEIWLYPFEEGAAPRPFLKSGFGVSGARSSRLSPDGRWMAYTTSETGRPELYVTAFPGSGGKWQISNEGVSFFSNPLWGPDGREVFYRNGRKVIRVAVVTSPSFSASRPELLFEGDYGGYWDIARDGRRFLMVKEERAEPEPKQINVVLDWFTELKARGLGGGT